MKKLMSIMVLLFVAVFPMSCYTQSVEAIIDSLKRQYAPDSRVAVWEVKTSLINGVWLLKGKMDCLDNKLQILSELERQNIRYRDSIKILDKGWGMVKLSVASLRTQGRHSAEMATQAIMGTPVKILEETREWYRVQTPDGYIAYVPSSSIVIKSDAQMSAWRKARRVIITVGQTTLFAASSDTTSIVSDLVLGNILEYRGTEGNWIKAVTPDGREGCVRSAEVADFDVWAQQDFDADVVINTAKSMMGSGYLWGGTSTKLTDCSGFTKVCYFSNGIILQRDASQQALTGIHIAASDWKTKAQKGDLLFWGTQSGRVTHVGLYIADGEYIHCSGQVKYNSLDPQDTLFLKTPFLSISRVAGSVGNRGIMAVKEHSWYF